MKKNLGKIAHKANAFIEFIADKVAGWIIASKNDKTNATIAYMPVNTSYYPGAKKINPWTFRDLISLLIIFTLRILIWGSAAYGYFLYINNPDEDIFSNPSLLIGGMPVLITFFNIPIQIYNHIWDRRQYQPKFKITQAHSGLDKKEIIPTWTNALFFREHWKHLDWSTKTRFFEFIFIINDYIHFFILQSLKAATEHNGSNHNETSYRPREILSVDIQNQCPLFELQQQPKVTNYSFSIIIYSTYLICPLVALLESRLMREVRRNEENLGLIRWYHPYWSREYGKTCLFAYPRQFRTGCELERNEAEADVAVVPDTAVVPTSIQINRRWSK